jgi:hypothetical protein
MSHFIIDDEFAQRRRSRDLPIGFTPIRNKRIDAAIAAAALALLKAGKLHPREVHVEAVRQVARILPAPEFGRRLRMPKPSKSDSPVYRKQACAVA